MPATESEFVCPYCMSETMIERVNAWQVVHLECLDCGYIKPKKSKRRSA